MVPDMFFTSVQAPSRKIRDNQVLQVLTDVHKLLLEEGTPNGALNQYKLPNLHGCTKLKMKNPDDLVIVLVATDF